MRRPTLLATICLLAGAAAIVHGLTTTLPRALASSGWPATTGRIEASEVIRGTGGTAMPRSPGYQARVTYSYVVAGTRYRSDRVSYRDDIAKSRAHAEQIAARYPVGNEVTVTYDPDAPSTSVLEPGVGLATFAVPGFGVALVLAGIVFLVRGRRRAEE